MSEDLEKICPYCGKGGVEHEDSCTLKPNSPNKALALLGKEPAWNFESFPNLKVKVTGEQPNRLVVLGWDSSNGGKRFEVEYSEISRTLTGDIYQVPFFVSPKAIKEIKGQIGDEELAGSLIEKLNKVDSINLGLEVPQPLPANQTDFNLFDKYGKINLGEYQLFPDLRASKEGEKGERVVTISWMSGDKRVEIKYDESTKGFTGDGVVYFVPEEMKSSIRGAVEDSDLASYIIVSLIIRALYNMGGVPFPEIATNFDPLKKLPNLNFEKSFIGDEKLTINKKGPIKEKLIHDKNTEEEEPNYDVEEEIKVSEATVTLKAGDTIITLKFTRESAQTPWELDNESSDNIPSGMPHPNGEALKKIKNVNLRLQVLFAFFDLLKK